MMSQPSPTVQASFDPEDAELLGKAIEDFAFLARQWPQSSCCYINAPGIVELSRLPTGMTNTELQVAMQLWDIHSLLCAQMLFAGWRAEQLSRNLEQALTRWELITSACMARSLIETASAFVVESGRFQSCWQKGKDDIETPGKATKFRLLIQKDVVQSIWGTRLAEYLANHKRFERVNILTFIDKAAKMSGAKDLRPTYDHLCDAVHPCFGSNESFWTETGMCEKPRQIRILFQRTSGGRSETINHIFRGTMWALNQLRSDLTKHKQCCDEMCLKLKLWRIPDLKYFGIVRPT